ncbi:hypothetical protein LEN26_018455 [Aphanomyces euteiches]|nr:hypothetical protein LEN26_018455 [Aphanomyces euteiches]KAH9191814.1 hypothetical protein AeNC1_006201 [Aphanomyces euteiches]
MGAPLTCSFSHPRDEQRRVAAHAFPLDFIRYPHSETRSTSNTSMLFGLFATACLIVQVVAGASPAPASNPTLDDLRNNLTRQEDTIIFALIERAQFVHNQAIYRKPAGASDPLLRFKGKYCHYNGSFLDFMLNETERLDALLRRYTSPEENAFFPASLPAPILPPLDYAPFLVPNTVNINDQVMTVYLEKLLPNITVDDDKPKTYGSSANADIAALQALSKRIHYGKFVAEAKFQAETERYTQLICNNDTDGIMAALTNVAVENNVVKRVRMKTSAFAQDIDVTASNSTVHYKVDPDAISGFYHDFVIPLTKNVEVAYLLQRLSSSSKQDANCTKGR